ncbi:flagellar hook capping protein [Acetomicrobium mobile DSM 13181]|uniref:Flagellar hook capping protein n=1 Tax=Acetomicrobium mobile (strain ATCC BAA-54 / DSM 13181 / JCM 12221 / NGA) TaxID=891968 RepID=I4BUH2_ACEMN|nr:flagellar hook assembly protein FlgD [Acetomicrobium mobile]AFM20929.1 flagellar hook capping protein [Acetomicrobium mobile DSM 13181]
MAIDSVSSTNQNYTYSASRQIKNNLGKDDFLNLLITQLTHQDPLDPIDDTEFIAQMAQFSTLEQITNVASSMDSLLKMARLSAESYVGKEVIYYDEDKGTYLQSSVRSAIFEDDKVYLELNDGKYVPLESVKAVTAPSKDGGD